MTKRNVSLLFGAFLGNSLRTGGRSLGDQQGIALSPKYLVRRALVRGACCPYEEPSPEARHLQVMAERARAGLTAHDLPHQTSPLALQHKVNENLKGLILEVKAWTGLHY